MFDFIIGRRRLAVLHKYLRNEIAQVSMVGMLAHNPTAQAFSNEVVVVMSTALRLLIAKSKNNQRRPSAKSRSQVKSAKKILLANLNAADWLSNMQLPEVGDREAYAWAAALIMSEATSSRLLALDDGGIRLARAARVMVKLSEPLLIHHDLQASAAKHLVQESLGERARELSADDAKVLYARAVKILETDLDDPLGSRGRQAVLDSLSQIGGCGVVNYDIRARRTNRHRSSKSRRLTGGRLYARDFVTSLCIWMLSMVGALSMGALSIELALLTTILFADSIPSVLQARFLSKAPYLPILTRSTVASEVSALICIPVILSSERRQIDRLVWTVSENESSCPEVPIVLLVDLPDSDTEHVDGDDELLQSLVDAVESASAKGHKNRHILVRRRIYSRRQMLWMGWERKRGKLLEFMRALRGEKTSWKDLSEIGTLSRTTHIMVIDEDSVVTEGSLPRLLRAASWEPNRPVVNAVGRVVQGHAILVPNAYTSADSRRCWRRGSSAVGSPPRYGRYSFERSFSMDCFGECLYPGKGLIDIDAYMRSAATSLASDSVLSHDILESSILRPGLVQGSSIIERAPQDYTSLTERSHRWMRGDWHNFIWMISGLASGKVSRTKFVGPAYLAILRLARRSVAKIGNGLALVLIISAHRDKQLPWLGIYAVATQIPTLYDTLHAGGLREKLLSVLGGAAGAVTQMVFALHQAALALDAMLIAIYRAIRGNRILNWKTCSSLDFGRKMHSRSQRLLLLSSFASLIALATTVTFAHASFCTASMLLAWAAAPLLTRAL